jgi:hypothetical protein
VCLNGDKYPGGACAATGCELGSNFGCPRGATCVNGGDGQTYCLAGCGVDQSGCFVHCERDGYAYPSSAVMTISSNSDLQIRLPVNESQVSDIKVGQKATITGVGFKNSSYSGTVKSISSDAKQVTTTNGQDTVIDVIVSVEKPNTDIKPGFTAKAKIVTSESSNILVAPYEAVRADNNGNEYVFKLNGKQAVKVPITTNREFDNGFEIKSGLNKNDKIVLNPDNLTNGAWVIPSAKGTVQPHD